MSIAGILRRWVVVSAVTGVLALIQVPGVRAQAVQPVPMPPNPNPNQPVPMAPSPGSNQPVQMSPSPALNPLNSPAYGDTGARTRDGARDGRTGTPPQVPLHSPTGLSALEVIRGSLFDDIYSPEAQARWTPLPLGTFFTEGWDQPFVNPTAAWRLAGTGGSPRHGWVNAFGGSFFRAWFFAFAYDQGINRTTGNGYVGQYTIFIPMNRRFEIHSDSHRLEQGRVESHVPR